MKAFGNKPEDYFDNAVSEFPVPARALLCVARKAVWLWSKIYWHWTYDGDYPFTAERVARKREAGEPGYVLVANHASMLDPALLMAMAGGKGVRLRPMYKSEFGSSRFVTGFFATIGAIPIKRGTADMAAIKRAANALKRGENILIFPEGTRIWDPAERPEVHGGFAFIAQMAKAQVVPVAIDGTELINPNKSHRLSRPARVRLRFGAPIDIADVEGASRKEKVAALERVSMQEVYRMREDIRRENGKS